MRLFFVKNGYTLMPSGQSDKDKLAKVPNGEIIVDIKVPRSLQHHRKLFAIIRMALDNWKTPGMFQSEENLLDALKFECGFVKPIKRLDGRVFFETKSISFTECDQTEFKSFYDNVVSVLARYFECSIFDIENNSMEYHQ